MSEPRHKAKDLRLCSRTDLLKQLEELKRELSGLRVSKVTGGALNKLSKISVVRKSIHRILTIQREQQKKQLVDSFRQQREENPDRKIHLPLDLRPKLTRAKRRALTKMQRNKRTLRMQRKHAPKLRIYALKP